MLLSNSKQRDGISRARYQLEQQQEERESANLLYVALTRAKSMLVISGCESGHQRKLKSWYQQIAATVCDETAPSEPWVHTFKQPPVIDEVEPARQTASVDVDPRLQLAIATRPLIREIAPSRRAEAAGLESGSAEGQHRGLAIHRMLQLATQAPGLEADAEPIVARVATELGFPPDTLLLRKSWKEVEGLLKKEQLNWLFRPAAGSRVFNEIPIQYRHGKQTVYGIIDRLLVGDTHIDLIDYKTHRIERDTQALQLAEHYRPQLDLYREGVQRLWPDHSIRVYLLLTDGGKLVNIETPSSDPVGATPQ
jgi:ATP-dependent helicase/nuclease subunit A